MALTGAAAAAAFAAPAASAAPTSGNFANPDVTVIPSLANPAATSGPANRYPSLNRVRLMYPRVTNATVTFESLSHTFPADIDALLVGPRGQNVLLMSDAGGGNTINSVRLTFDDSAATSLPNVGQITSGTFRPTNYGSPDPFPSPAPTGSPPGVFGALLAGFNGTNPNGTWRLFINDDAGGDVGQLDRWTLHLRAAPRPGACANPLIGTPGADRITGGRGGDRIRGRGGDDVLRGGRGRDCISGGTGNDRIFGGSGRDRISAVDGTRDFVNCGSGFDRARVDRRDVVRRCESVTRVG
jgi:hypothetical protein